MLRTGFLGTVSDWVSKYYTNLHSSELNKAAEEFDLDRLLHNAEDPDKLLGIFSEWLVFDRKSPIFGDRTGLEYFVAENPLALDGETLSAYADLLQYKVGIFSVKEVQPAQNVTLVDMNGATYVLHDVNTSLNVTGGSVWGRIAQVSGLYQGVGCVFAELPFTFGAGFKRSATIWGNRDMNARELAHFLYGDRGDRDNNQVMASGGEDGEEVVSHADCQTRYGFYRDTFTQGLRACGMQNMLTTETFEKWLKDERRFSPNFYARALFFLVPLDVTDTDRKTLFDAAMNFANYVPRPRLKGKCPVEMKQKSTNGKSDLPVLEQDFHSTEQYEPYLEKANDHSKNLEWRKAYDAYAETIKQLLHDKTPNVIAFRLFANAAVACFNESEERFTLGAELVQAALRLNPQYDFGLGLKKKYVDPYYTIAQYPEHLSKAECQEAEILLEQVRNRGYRQYRRSVFAKYEDFLKRCGISLSHNTDTIITEYSRTGTVCREKKMPKPGRNAPCYCGSGKKYKKCCGG